MTRDEATGLAVRILQTFNGPPTDTWEEELQNLDPGRAGTALARLRREHEHRWLSIATFMAQYRALNTDDPTTRGPQCANCDGSGWTTAPDIVIDPNTDHARRYTAVQPCRCPEGRHAEQSSAWKHRTRQETP